MRWSVPRFVAPLVIAASAFACSPPPTDVVATNTESTGEYRVIEARRGDRLFVRACLTPGADTERIAARLVQQLVNHGYQGIDLELIEASGGNPGAATATKVTWSRSNGRRIEGRAAIAQNPCANQSVHGTSS